MPPSIDGCAPCAKAEPEEEVEWGSVEEPAAEPAGEPADWPAEEAPAAEAPAAEAPAAEAESEPESLHCWEPGQETAYRTWVGKPAAVDVGVWPPTRNGHPVPPPDAQGWAANGVGGWYLNGKCRIMFRQDVGLEPASMWCGACGGGWVVVVVYWVREVTQCDVVYIWGLEGGIVLRHYGELCSP